ncbi:unnamed protein product, partial [Didymodactylos carnosus]
MNSPGPPLKSLDIIMSSVVFQPLLHDSIGWKNPNTTYTDHYKWKQYRLTLKDKKVSSYGQEYQKQQQQKIQQQSQNASKSEHLQPQPIMTIKRVENRLEKRPDENDVKSVKVKNDFTLNEDTNDSGKPVYIVEWKRRPTSTSYRPFFSYVLEQLRPKTSILKHTTEKDEVTEKPVVKRATIDPNDPQRHWLTYPNPPTPQYLIDIKKRLGQLRGDPPKPPASERPLSASNHMQVNEANQQQRPSSASQPVERHFLTYIPSETPLELRTARYRLRKERYNPSLDNFPTPEVKEAFTRELRPHTAPVSLQRQRQEELEKKKIDDENNNNNNSQVWTNESSSNSSILQQQENGDQNNDTVYVQIVNCDGLPNEYVDALETASIAVEQYEMDKRQLRT